MITNGWKPTAIHELIAESVPGEWGTEGSPEMGVPVLRSTNFVDDGTIDYSDIAFRKVPLARLEKRRINTGTLLMEKAGGSSTRPAGRVVFCDRNFNGTASNFVEIIKVREEHSPKYVFYLFYHNFHTGLVYKYQQQTTGIINFKIREYSEEIVDVPVDKTEQSKIEEVLSTVDRAIEQTEALIAKQHRIKTGLMQDVLARGIDEQGNLRSEETHQFKDSPLGRIPVEWDAKRLSEVADLRVGYAFKSSWFAEDGVRLLRGENVGTGKADWKDTQWLPHHMAEKYPEYVLAEGDLVIGMDRTFTKQGFKVTLLGATDVPCLLVQRVGCFVPLGIPAQYMRLLIQSPEYQRELLLQQKGMDIPHLSKSEILSPLVPVPNETTEMDEISNRVGALRASIENNIRYLAKLCSMKTALMQDLLTGEKRVTPLLESAVTN